MIAMVFDTETSGLVKNSLVPLNGQPSVIEFFGQLVDSEDGRIIKELEFFCDPGFTIDPVITRITGITAEQLVSEKPFNHYSAAVREMINESEAVVAHNLSFDMAIIDYACARCNDKPLWPERRICTVEQTEWMKGHRLSLSALHEELFGEPFAGAHRARVDVQALTRCFLELVKRGDL